MWQKALRIETTCESSSLKVTRILINASVNSLNSSKNSAEFSETAEHKYETVSIAFDFKSFFSFVSASTKKIIFFNPGIKIL